MHYIEVAPTRLIRKDATFFTYSHTDPLPIGTIVSIPIGKTTSVGIVLGNAKKPTFTTKPIAAVLSDKPIPQALIETSKWMSKYYKTHLSQCLALLLPTGITKTRRARPTKQTSQPIRERTPKTPTKPQHHAISRIVESPATTHILFGVTGSGKTLVYIETARTLFAQGLSSIILVPEIALTSQIVDEFRNVFGDDVILTHSRQTEAERHLAWQSVHTATKPKVIIGPRSALFLPIAKLGLIVLDEFHEPSYKQEQQPRYSSLRVATILARHHKARAVFGSATPPVSELYIAKNTTNNILSLPSPAQVVQPPTVHVVDMTNRSNFLQHRFLSDVLLSSIEASLSSRRQVLIFHNRRGTASTTLCTNCGWTATDPSNDIPLTLHADTHLLTSHLTGFSMPVPLQCPQCGNIDIIYKGIGTKLIEQELLRLFPQAVIVRFDADSEKNDTVEKRYQELYSGKIDIIIGTQVIAKGIDLPKLQTVGVIQADAGLALPDYSSNERVFQLLSQAVGRVGRQQSSSTVVVQSYQPQHPAIAAGTAQNYDMFYTHELAQRQHGSFPPFTYLARFTCSYKTESATIKNTKKIYQRLRQFAKKDVVLAGPMPAFYERQNHTYRWHIIAKSPSRTHLVELLNHLPATHWQYELDPTSLL